MNEIGTAEQLVIGYAERDGGTCTARNLFSWSVSRILSEKWKMKEAVESSAGDSKVYQVTWIVGIIQQS